jgi:hypothetical protein
VGWEEQLPNGTLLHTPGHICYLTGTCIVLSKCRYTSPHSVIQSWVPELVSIGFESLLPPVVWVKSLTANWVVLSTVFRAVSNPMFHLLARISAITWPFLVLGFKADAEILVELAAIVICGVVPIGAGAKDWVNGWASG